MDRKTITSDARRLGWTREQVAFLTDRLRNALAVLSAHGISQELREQASDKLLFTLEAIESAAFRVRPGKTRLVHGSPPSVPPSRRPARKPKKSKGA